MPACGGVHAFRAAVTNNTHVIAEAMSMEILIYLHCRILRIVKKNSIDENRFFANLVSNGYQCLLYDPAAGMTLLICIHSFQFCIYVVHYRKPACKSQPEQPEVRHGQQQDSDADTGAHHPTSESQQEQRAGGEDCPVGVQPGLRGTARPQVPNRPPEVGH